MGKTVILWKLNEIMARKRVRNKDLADALGIDENSVYRLRKTDFMPRLTGERLNGICKILNCQPGDLLEFVPDEGNEQTLNQKRTQVNASASINQISDDESTESTSVRVIWLATDRETA